MCLPDSKVVAVVVQSLENDLQPGTLLIDATTGDPDDTATLAARLRERGIGYVDATIAGSSEQVRQGQAVVIIGGDLADVERAGPVLASWSDRRFHVGPPGSGARLKLVVNLVLGLNRAVLAEGLALAQACGIAPAAALEVLKASPAWSAAMDTKGPKMVAGDFAPQARLAQHLKDVGLIRELARRCGAITPLSDVHEELLARAVELGWGEADNSAILQAFAPQRPHEPMIEVVELTKRFPGPRRDVVAVDRLSLSVPRGEVYGLLGENGAGKTTTLRMILGLLAPTSGHAEVDGFRSTDAPDAVKSRIGLVSTTAGLYQWLTPREMLLFFADLYDVPPRQAEASLARLVELFGLSEFLDRRCATLSTGQKQRVNLARSLIHDPPVLLLDEPTRGLDVLGSKVIFDYIGAARAAGKAVIVSTHRLDEAERFCDRFGLLHRGRLMHTGTLAELQAATGLATLTEMFLQGLAQTGEAA